MDTLTHTLCGIGIAFAANTVSPELVEMSLAFTGFSVLAANSPDFDTVTKAFGNVTFINNHRGLTHTILMWPVLSLPLALIFSLLTSITLPVLFTVAMMNVALHVFLDVLNSYGTMILPRGRWVRLSVTHTFDPIITSVLVLGIVLTVFEIRNFPFIIGGVLLYIILRIIYKWIIYTRVTRLFPNSKKTIIIAKSNPFTWYCAIEMDKEYHTFKFMWKKPIRIHTVKKCPIDPQLVKVAQDDPIFKLFHKFSPMFYAHIEGNHILLSDLRYRTGTYYYFKATFVVDDSRKKILNSYVGWVFNERKRISKVTV